MLDSTSRPRSTEVELSTIHARSPHHPAANASPEAVEGEDDVKTPRKSLEMVEAAQTGGSHPSDAPETAVPASTPAMRRKATLMYATSCWCYFLAGWNDGTTGPLLPRIQSVYHVRSLFLLLRW